MVKNKSKFLNHSIAVMAIISKYFVLGIWVFIVTISFWVFMNFFIDILFFQISFFFIFCGLAFFFAYTNRKKKKNLNSLNVFFLICFSKIIFLILNLNFMSILFICFKIQLMLINFVELLFILVLCIFIYELFLNITNLTLFDNIYFTFFLLFLISINVCFYFFSIVSFVFFLNNLYKNRFYIIFSGEFFFFISFSLIRIYVDIFLFDEYIWTMMSTPLKGFSKIIHTCAYSGWNKYNHSQNLILPSNTVEESQAFLYNISKDFSINEEHFPYKGSLNNYGLKCHWVHKSYLPYKPILKLNIDQHFEIMSPVLKSIKINNNFNPFERGIYYEHIALNNFRNSNCLFDNNYDLLSNNENCSFKTLTFSNPKLKIGTIYTNIKTKNEISISYCGKYMYIGDDDRRELPSGKIIILCRDPNSAYFNNTFKIDLQVMLKEAKFSFYYKKSTDDFSISASINKNWIKLVEKEYE